MKQTNKLIIAIIIGIMCCFLTAGIVVQIKTVKSSTTTVGKTLAENELRDSVLRWKEKYENAYQKLETKEAELESMRAKVSNSSGSASGLSTKLEKYNALLGYTEVVGKGITVTLNDGDSSTAKGMPVSEYIVHDQDLYEIVNALKNSGAEAISINNQRIVSRTAITCVGNVIKINGEKVGAPFVISAIGSPYQLYNVTMPGGYIEYIQSCGVQVEVKQIEKNTIVIPKYEGVYNFKYASNIE